LGSDPGDRDAGHRSRPIMTCRAGAARRLAGGPW